MSRGTGFPSVSRTGGGARPSGNRPTGSGAAFSFTWVRIFSITAGSSMQAMILTAPPHSRQVSMSMSMLKTRFNRCAQVMDARRSARRHPNWLPCQPVTATRSHPSEFLLCFRLAAVWVVHQLATCPEVGKAELPLYLGRKLPFGHRPPATARHP